ncbi:MAG TPA: FCD domain-containing protein [Geminicoccaceae bacterium]|nr:FCD domain-containing protein [Geminicoccaceae bacterium]
MVVVVAERFDARNIETLTNAVQREIERRILTGEIAAGARLTEAALAEELGVSRGPVREAIRGLIQAGLVDSVANRGGVVRKIGLEEALDLYELRAVLFAFACELVAKRRTAEQLAALEAALEDMAAAVAARDKERYYQLNLAFHAKLMEFCGNRRLRADYEGVIKEMHLFRRRSLSQVSRINASLAEHRTIVAAIRAGDARKAFQAGREHVQHGRERFVATLKDPA